MWPIIRNNSGAVIGALFILAVLATAIPGLRSPEGKLEFFGAMGAYHEGTQGLLKGVNPYPPPEWLEGNERPTEARFVYSPTFALFFYPFSLLYGPAGVVAWIVANTALFWYGLTFLLKMSGDGVSPVKGKWLLLVALMMFNETLKCVLCLQVNALIAGMMMAGVGLYFAQRFAGAALLLALAANFKIFPLVIALLLGLNLNRRFIGWFAVFLLASFALPFLVADSAFNIELLRSWWFFISHDPLKPGFLGLEPSLLFFGFHVPDKAFATFALLNALAIAVVARLAFARDRRAFFDFVVPLALCFMLLFNKRTESPTFVVALPVLAIMLHAFLKAREDNDPLMARIHLAAMLVAWWLVSLSYSDLTPKPLRHMAHEYRFMFFGLLFMYAWAWARFAALIFRPVRPGPR